MAWRREYWAYVVLLVLLSACDGGREAFAPSFMVVSPPGSLTATAVAFNQINLIWQDNSTSETGFEVYRSTTGPAGSFSLYATTGPRATSYGDYGVAGSAQYCYEVRAFRTTGRKNNYSDFSSVACATTPRAPVPAAPSAVRAAPYFGLIRVDWTDNSSDESAFRIERASTVGGPWTTIATFGANNTSLYDYGIAPEQPACYRVFASNVYGDSDPSNVACTAVPAAPSDLRASLAGTGVNLTWTDNSGVEDGVEVQRAAEGATWTVIANLPANATSYHDEPPPDNTYTYLVSAKKDGGTSGSAYSEPVVVAISAPAVPTYADAVPAGSTTVGVFWSDELSLNETGFRVERMSDGATWTAAGNTGLNGTAFWDYPVPSEELVCYRVVAVNLVGESPSDSSCTKPPAAPTAFPINQLDAETIEFTWTDNSNVEQGYQVWLYDGYDDPWPIATLDSNTTSFQYVDPYWYYYSYFVVAIRDGGMSDQSWFATSAAGSAAVRGSPSRVTLRQLLINRHQRKANSH